MNFFKDNIKNLRKAKGLTQEALADVFGISFQAVSKWERGESYPDVSMLPAIARFFCVSVDFLLGIDDAVKAQKIAEYVEKFDKMKLSDVSALLDEFKTAVRAFPSEFSLLIRYMELLIIEKDSALLPDYEATSREITLIYENIKANCTDDSIRICAKELMCRHLIRKYQCTGYKGEHFAAAKNIIDELPCLASSREYVSLMLSIKENHAKMHLDVIEELMYLLQNTVVGYCYYENDYTPEYKINVIKNMNSLLEVFCPDGKNSVHRIYNLGHLGHLYAQIGDCENGLRFLRQAAECALEWDKKDENREFLKFYEQESKYRSITMCERMTLLMKKHYPLSEEFKNSQEFKGIMAILS